MNEIEERWETEADEIFDKEYGGKGDNLLERIRLKLWHKYGYVEACRKGQEEIDVLLSGVKELQGHCDKLGEIISGQTDKRFELEARIEELEGKLRESGHQVRVKEILIINLKQRIRELGDK